MRLRLDRLAKSFWREGRYEVRAVDGFSCALGTGDFVALVGPNGCGKTTLASLIGGTHIPDAGRIVLDDLDITKSGPQARTFVGRVYQDPTLGSAPYLTVRENLCLSQIGKPCGWRRAVTRKRLDLARTGLEAVGVGGELVSEPLLSAQTWQLSGGERQLLNLAMLALREPAPSVVVADEPTASLDPQHAAKCIDVLRKMADERSVLLITHQLAIARSAPRVWVMARGKLVADLRLPGQEDSLQASLRSAYGVE